MNVFETKDWFSVADTAARLTRTEGTPVSTDDVLQLLICGKLQASIRSGQVFATPLVAMTAVESQSFIGTSWTKPNGERIARTGDEVVLTAIFPLLDLPVCLSGVGHLVNNAYENSLDVSKQVPIPPGTLLQTPNKDEYFAVLGGTDIPGTNGQIVIRTDALREYQSRLIVHKKYLAANDDAAAVVAESASGGVEQTPDPERRLARLRVLGGTSKYARGEWKFTGMAALVESEKADDRNRCSEKTIRADLIQAAQAEHDGKSAGFGAGLGQR